MKFLPLLAAAALTLGAAPAKADTITDWQTPTECHRGHKFASDKKLTESFCNKVGVSSEGGTHNIRFRTNEKDGVTYITRYATPNVVYAIALWGPNGQTVVPAVGDCKAQTSHDGITIYSCGAVTQYRALQVTHIAAFGGQVSPVLHKVLN